MKEYRDAKDRVPLTLNHGARQRHITLRCVIPVVCVTNEREENAVKQHN